MIGDKKAKRKTYEMWKGEERKKEAFTKNYRHQHSLAQYILSSKYTYPTIVEVYIMLMFMCVSVYDPSSIEWASGSPADKH